MLVRVRDNSFPTTLPGSPANKMNGANNVFPNLGRPSDLPDQGRGTGATVFFSAVENSTDVTVRSAALDKTSVDKKMLGPSAAISPCGDSNPNVSIKASSPIGQWEPPPDVAGVLSQWQDSGFDCSGDMDEVERAAEAILSVFDDDRPSEASWRALSGLDPASATKWVEACCAYRAALGRASSLGLRLQNSEHAQAAAVLLRRAIAVLSDVDLNDGRVGDLPGILERLSREAEEAHQAQLLLSTCREVLGLDGQMGPDRARMLVAATTLAGEVPPIGGMPQALRPPGGTEAAGQAARCVEQLRALHKSILAHIRLPTDVPLEQVRHHADALRHGSVFSFFSRASRAAKRFYASIKQSPQSASRAQAAQVLCDLKDFEEAKYEFARRWERALGSLFHDIDTDPNIVKAVAQWAEKTQSTLAAYSAEGRLIAEILLAADGRALIELCKLSMNPRLPIVLKTLPWKQQSIHEQCSWLEEERDRVSYVVTTLARLNLDANTLVSALPEVARAVEALALAAADARPLSNSSHDPIYALDPIEDLPDYEKAIAALARLRASPLASREGEVIAASNNLGIDRLVSLAHGLHQAYRRANSDSPTMPPNSDQPRSVLPEFEEPASAQPVEPFQEDVEALTTERAETAGLTMIAHRGGPSDPAKGYQQASEQLGQARGDLIGVPTEALRLFEVSGDADEEPEGGEITAERVIASPWREPAARRAVGFAANRRVDGRMSTMRINPLPIDAPERSLWWLCFGPQGEIDVWRTSDPYAEPALEAVLAWLSGYFMTFRGALATTMSLADVWAAVIECVDERSSAVLRRRVAGDTLDAIAMSWTVTRERIRQIEARAVERVTARCLALRAIAHPAFLALEGHMTRLADGVLAAASMADGVLLPDAKLRWIRQTLPPDEADVLSVMLLASDEVDADVRSVFDPLSVAGKPFQGGRTTQPWSDQQVNAVKEAFDRLCAGRARRWESLGTIAREAGLGEALISVLAKFASLAVQGGWVFEGRLRAGDGLRILAADILKTAERPMSDVELFEELIAMGVQADDTLLRDIGRHLSADPGAFVSDGRANWQLRSELGDTVLDFESQPPDLPPPMPRAELLEKLEHLRGGTCVRAVLNGLRYDDNQFPIQAGGSLVAALSRLPMGERRSLGQVLDNGDESKLISWLSVASSASDPTESDGEEDVPVRILVGLIILAAFTAAVRKAADTNTGHWTAIRDVCGEQARAWLFDTQDVPRKAILSRIAEVAIMLGLRRDFGRGDPWVGLITLQAGLRTLDLAPLSRWLSSRQPPVSVRLLVAPGLNHSSSMVCAWNALNAYQRGDVARSAIDTLAECCEWWPAWVVADVCRALEFCPEVRLSESAAVSERPGPDESGARVSALWQHGELAVGIETELERAGEVAKPEPGGRLLDNLNSFLAATGDHFCVALPERFALPPGPVTLIGEDFRVGGEVQANGSVRWHGQSQTAKIKLRGASERGISLERHNELLEACRIQLWPIGSYIAAFSLFRAVPRRLTHLSFRCPAKGVWLFSFINLWNFRPARIRSIGLTPITDCTSFDLVCLRKPRLPARGRCFGRRHIRMSLTDRCSTRSCTSSRTARR